MVDKDDLLDRLQKLNESQIEELIYRLRVNRFHLRAGTASTNEIALDLIKILEPQADGLQRLRRNLEKLLTPYEFDDPATLPACPYRGLLAFQENDAEFFFGREAFIDDWVQEDGSVRQGLVRTVGTKSLVAVVGASGSGKSSLVFAGLLPRLRPSGNWLIESMRPEKQPFFRLAIALMRQLEPDLSRIDRIAKANDLASTIQKHGIASVVSEIFHEHPGKRLLLIVDQFEELYTQCSAEERDCFIDVLLEGINKAVGLKVVLTLRADFCGQAYAYRPLADALQGADLKLGPMNRDELQQAIEQPAQLMQLEFEEGLTEWLLDDVGQEAGNLPLLEFALTELWKMQRQRTLVYEAYIRLGGVAKALAKHADSVYAKLSPEDQRRAQQIFVQLVRPGDGTEDTRRVASRDEVGEKNWDLVARLAGEDARLVVTGRNKGTVEIVHEALLSKWQQLREWMEQDRDFRVWQENLRFARRQWQQSGQEESALLDGFLLSQAEEWQSKRRKDLSLEDQEFIQQSLKTRDRRIQQRLDELQELVEQKDKALQAEAAAAEQAIRASKQAEKAAKAARVRTLAVSFGSVAILASGSFGWWQQYRSEQARQQALQSIQDISLGIDIGTPELLRLLPEFLKQAEQDEDPDRAMAYYRKIISEVNKLQAELIETPEKFPKESDKLIQQFRVEAENGLIDKISQNLLPELRDQLQIGLDSGSFGEVVKDDWFLKEKMFEPGAVRTSYQILLQSTGADINGNGYLDNAIEANQIPNELIIEVEKTWREATDCRCGWYGLNNPYTSDCSELNFNSLFSFIFAKLTDYLALNLLAESGIKEFGYSEDVSEIIRCPF